MDETVASLRTQAVARTGLSDFGGAWFEEPLGACVRDLSGPRSNEVGREDLEMPPILYVTGLKRSGTTFLHNLLALPPEGARAASLGDDAPLPPPEAETYTGRTAASPRCRPPSIVFRGTLLERMHWVNADEPEECTLTAIDCTGLMGRSPIPLMPTWSQCWRTTI